jgi:protein TonB
MLQDCLFASHPHARTKRPLTLVVSVMTHGVIAGALIIIPLFQSQVLPQVPFFSPLRPPTLAARSVELVPAARPAGGSSASASESRTLTTPPAIPTRIIRTTDEPVLGNSVLLPPGGNGPGPFFDFSIGVPGGQAAPPPPPPAPAEPPRPPVAAAAPTGPVPRGGVVMQSNLLYSVTPVYPRLAVVTRVQGAVLIEAVITREGTIDASRLRVISGHVLLVPASVEAVKQWRYRPTLLNGEPVEILTTITVNFTLN